MNSKIVRDRLLRFIHSTSANLSYKLFGKDGLGISGSSAQPFVCTHSVTISASAFQTISISISGVLIVLFFCTFIKMIRINASLIVTSMQRLETFFYRST